MNKLLFPFLLFIGTLGYSQETEPKIPWTQEKKLVWEEFQGKPDASVPFEASTSSGISFSWSLKTKGKEADFVYEVSSCFYPERSWVKPENGSADLLAHEQLHFDISELFARKLRQDLAAYRIGPNIKSDLNRFYQQRERERREMQTKYDKESQHGIKKEVQTKWQGFVWKELSGELFSPIRDDGFNSPGPQPK